MKELFFKDNFIEVPDKMYPQNFICEQNCELPYKLGTIINHQFCIMCVGNKHIPCIPELKNFKLLFSASTESFYRTMGLEIFFRYDRVKREGWCLRYNWGICGGKTHQQQADIPEYECTLLRYSGKKAVNKYEVIVNARIKGFVTDISKGQLLELLVKDNSLSFSHADRKVANFIIPDNYPESGRIALDKSHSIRGFNGIHRIFDFTIEAPYDNREKVMREEIKTQFPSGINGIISPYFFHVKIIEKNGIKTLRAKLSGGPDEKYLKTLNRYRFNEKMYKPYIRIENIHGNTLGTYYLADGSVGLNDYNWNVDCSGLSPSDCQCPLSQDFPLENLPSRLRIFIGYEYYIAEDSICNAGGPSEALIDDNGNILWSGPSFAADSVNFKIISPDNKKICKRIPKDIPFYNDALAFAQNNHFFIEEETVKFKVVVDSRDKKLDKILALITIEDVFGNKLKNYEIPFRSPENLSFIDGAKRFSTEFFEIDELDIGVYHICVRIFGAALETQRYTFEVMPENSQDLCAPLASGLPKLWPNILSGIKNEHFHPWSHATVDTIHYNSGGNNYFEIAKEWHAPELLHIYGREWLYHVGNGLGQRNDYDADHDLIPQSDCTSIILGHRYDLWGKAYYKRPFVFETLLKFLKSNEFIEAEHGILNFENLTQSSPRELTQEEFLELFKHNWKKWIVFFTKLNTQRVKGLSSKISDVSNSCKPFSFCPVYPTYGSNYKSAYFPLLFGIDLRDNFAQYFPGANGFEDYPFSSGYPIAKGIYSLASCKLEAPDLPLHPEVFAINGETLDARVVFANPPLGQSDPPYGFLIKQFYEYSFAVTWFNEKGFNYWKDHGYHIKTFDRENYQELLYAYSFISKVTPEKPLRTSAFIFSRDACLAHPDYYEHDEDLFAGGSVVNTAEEAVAFAYEEARRDGQQAGFVMKLEDIGHLSPEDVDTLILPPLCGVDEKCKMNIRKLHSQGVALLGFENVDGLEDLFGIKKSVEKTITHIIPGTHLSTRELEGLYEETEHELCAINHELAGAETLLATPKGDPILTLYNKTSFFTLPPTFVKRSKTMVPSYGQRNNSKLIAMATRLAMRQIGDKAINISAGSLIAFWDIENNLHIIVSEDKNPEESVPIRPQLEISIPGLKTENIKSDKDFELVSANEKTLRLRFHLDIAESIRITCRL